MTRSTPTTASGAPARPWRSRRADRAVVAAYIHEISPRHRASTLPTAREREDAVLRTTRAWGGARIAS